MSRPMTINEQKREAQFCAMVSFAAKTISATPQETAYGLAGMLLAYCDVFDLDLEQLVADMRANPARDKILAEADANGNAMMASIKKATEGTR